MKKSIIFCQFLEKEAEQQDFQIYPGELGKLIYNKISKEAWLQWISKQTVLINENKLSTINIQHRKFLEKKMINFLFKGKDIGIIA